MMRDHINGLSFRDIGQRYGISKSTAYRKVRNELEKVPDNNKVTFNHCSKFSNVFEFDAKYISIRGYLKCPVTTNMIEGFNSHLEERLKHINSFQSFLHAKLWLNAYGLKRRTTKLTDCRGKFKKINGKRPLELTQKSDVDLTTFF